VHAFPLLLEVSAEGRQAGVWGSSIISSLSEIMTIPNTQRSWPVYATIALFSSLTVLVSQTGTLDPVADENVFELSPFTVQTDASVGYQATATLAGTRVRTDLKDLASSISVITSKFLEDTGARSNETLLQYTTNTEVGGIFGNFAGVGNTQGIGEGRNLTAPSTNTRVRGLDAADNTRNYFLSDVPWDAYNVDRVELQRGPNSILFGVGSPAGIINTATIVPFFENGGK
jgi:outer membrane receptor protein involved in Fe transport